MKTEDLLARFSNNPYITELKDGLRDAIKMIEERDEEIRHLKSQLEEEKKIGFFAGFKHKWRVAFTVQEDGSKNVSPEKAWDDFQIQEKCFRNADCTLFTACSKCKSFWTKTGR